MTRDASEPLPPAVGPPPPENARDFDAVYRRESPVLRNWLRKQFRRQIPEDELDVIINESFLRLAKSLGIG